MAVHTYMVAEFAMQHEVTVLYFAPGGLLYCNRTASGAHGPSFRSNLVSQQDGLGFKQQPFFRVLQV